MKNNMYILAGVLVIVLLGTMYVFTQRNSTVVPSAQTVSSSTQTSSNVSSSTTTPPNTPVSSGTQISSTLGVGVIGHGIVQDANSSALPLITHTQAVSNGIQKSTVYKVQDINKTILEAQIKLGNDNHIRADYAGQSTSMVSINDLSGTTLYVTCGSVNLPLVGISESIPTPFGGTLSTRGCNPFSITAKTLGGKEILINAGAYN